MSRNILITLSAYCLICALVLPGMLSALPLDESNSNKDGLDGLLNSKKNEMNTNDQAAAVLMNVDPDDLDDASAAAVAADIDEQRTLASYYLALYLQELARENGQEMVDESNDDRYMSAIASSGSKLEKRASPRSTLIKKESPFEQQRNKEMRRQQAARWDIGFGKRAAYKPKAFMDALYGKRSNLFYKQTSPKLAYGRKQQWDIQYGRR